MMRYLLDTNILSEPARPYPNHKVQACILEYQELSATAAPVWHELHYGTARLPQGRRKQDLEKYLRKLSGSPLPILPYDGEAANLHANLRAGLEARGVATSYPDGQIASIALVHKLTLVTRNLRDFEAFPGLMLENWFD